VGRFAPDVAAAPRVIEHPLWRTYVFVTTRASGCWSAGWTSTAPGRRTGGRQWREQLTPGAIAADVAASTAAASTA
jgi:hypothetical protein